MRDLPGTLLVATIWAYWFAVGIMIGRARRETHRLGGLLPEQRAEQYLWLLWIPLVAAWNVVPYLALWHADAPWTLPAFARREGYGLLRWVAVLCGVASLLATSLCWARMGRHWRMDASAEKSELITDGPFRHVRHPIYALQRLLMLASLTIVPTWPMLALVVLDFALTHVKARYEERQLTAAHGSAYRDYAARTGSFMPAWRVRGHRSPATANRSTPGRES
jgi:protein-S-isoprenylcysteine O-methyltransferase Ste14